MKKITLCLFACIALLTAVTAQTATKDVTLHFEQINDTFGLDFSNTFKNWNQVNYNFSRTQFYVSEISLLHNNGDTIPLVDKYLLTKASQPDYDLGTHDLGTLDGILFHIGVPADVNHLDPAQYPANHPLALQIPDMHWGWSAGYRFFAFEGQVDNNQDGTPNRTWQYHGVGNQYYTAIDVQTAGVEVGSDLTININVNYEEMFNSIDMPIKSFEHGDGPQINTIVDNMRTRDVFTAGDGSTFGPPPPDTTGQGGNTGIEKVVDQPAPAKVFPNPFNHETQVQFDFQEVQNLTLVVADLHGRIIESYTNLPNKGNQMIQLDEPAGTYMYYFSNGNQILYQNKLTLLK